MLIIPCTAPHVPPVGVYRKPATYSFLKENPVIKKKSCSSHEPRTVNVPSLIVPICRTAFFIKSSTLSACTAYVK